MNYQTQNPALLVYEASAGSGKTFTMVAHYLRLCFINAHDPSYFKKILVLTFSLEATEQLRSEIINALYKIAEGQADTWLNIDFLGYEMWPEKLDVKSTAKKVLTSILYNYGSFGVRNIDSFIAETAAAAAGEMQADFVQNAQQIRFTNTDEKQEITKNFKRLICKSADRTMLALLQNMMREKLYGSEDIRPDAIIGNILGNKDIVETDTGYSDLSPVEIYNLASELKKNYQKQLHDFLVKNMPDPLSTAYNSITTKWITEWKNKAEKSDFASELLQNFEKLCTKGATGYLKKNEVDEGGQLSLLIDAYTKNAHLIPNYIYLQNLLKALPGTLLQNISNEARKEYNNKTGSISLSELIESFSRWMTESGNHIDIAMIMAGTKYCHIMVDEFQDTSTVQWTIIKPLIEENISKGNFCMLVGDPKQSIYRFRGSESKLLVNISSEFPEQVRIEKLLTNYRSGPEIVSFVNNFIKATNPGALGDHIIEAYQSVYANAEHRAAAGAKASILEVFHSKCEGKPEEYKEFLLNQVGDFLKSEHSTLAILNEANDTLLACFDILQYHENRAEFELSISSKDGLEKNIYISLLLNFLRYIYHPESRKSKTRECNPYLYSAAYHYSIIKNVSLTDAFKKIHELEKRVLAELQLDLLEICSLTLAQLDLDDVISDPRVDTFLTLVCNHIAENGNFPWDFLKKYEIQPHDYVPQDGAAEKKRIILHTVHASKGLGYDSVLLIVDKKQLIVGKKESLKFEFNNRELFDFTVTGEITASIAEILGPDKFTAQSAAAYLDKLNTNYVAITRAKRKLSILLTAESLEHNPKHATVPAVYYYSKACPDGNIIEIN